MLIFVCLTFLLPLFGASAKVLNDNVAGEKCFPTETRCGNGCCPFSNATCCVETQTCCEHGAICLGPLRMCLGLKTDDKNGSSLHSGQAVPLRGVTACPSGYTLCNNECCPFLNAVCCNDSLTCCPRKFNCGPGYCWSGKDQETYLNEVHPLPFSAKKSMLRMRSYSVISGKKLSSGKTGKLRKFTKCSSGYFQCYEGCCEDGDTCCNPFIGDYECCANYEFCTPFGCTHK